jgi:hypothetical protein
VRRAKLRKGSTFSRRHIAIQWQSKEATQNLADRVLEVKGLDSYQSYW